VISLEDQVEEDINKWFLASPEDQLYNSDKKLTLAYWNSYISSCEMSIPETGLEMPHEEDFTYSYHPNADEYNSRYGW
jgi:hypothetical protein